MQMANSRRFMHEKKSTLKKTKVRASKEIEKPVSVCDCTSTDDHLKELMRQQIISFLPDKNFSAYRMCKDLNLNQGNIFLWLKHGNQKAISYANAERVLDYIEALPAIK